MNHEAEIIQESNEYNSKIFSPNFNSIQKNQSKIQDNNKVSEFRTLKDYFETEMNNLPTNGNKNFPIPQINYRLAQI